MIKTNKQIQKSGDDSLNLQAGRDIHLHFEKNESNTCSKLINFNSRKEIHSHLNTFFQENLYIFNEYGPNNQERFNPESDLPAQWHLKIRDKIIPNNKHILECIEAHRHLLNDDEHLIVEEFKQHVHDFESRHLKNNSLFGKKFPQSITKVFGGI